MIPEFYLVLILIIVFVVDFIMHKSEKKHDVLSAVTIALTAVLSVRIALMAEPAEAFGGIYVTSQIANVMKVILTAGTVIVLIMSQAWLETNRRYEGEYYMLILSTLLGDDKMKELPDDYKGGIPENFKMIVEDYAKDTRRQLDA